MRAYIKTKIIASSYDDEDFDVEDFAAAFADYMLVSRTCSCILATIRVRVLHPTPKRAP